MRLYNPALFPNAIEYPSILLIVCPPTFNHIIVELAFELLSVAEDQNSPSLFSVITQSSFIGNPFLLKWIEIVEIEGFSQMGRIKTENFSHSVELIVQPLSFISQGTIGIVQLTKTMHLIVLPLTLISTAFREETLAKTLSHSIDQTSFIFSLNLSFEWTQHFLFWIFLITLGYFFDCWKIMFYFRFFRSHWCYCITVLLYVLFVEPCIFLLGLLVIYRGFYCYWWNIFELLLTILNDDIDRRLFLWYLKSSFRSSLFWPWNSLHHFLWVVRGENDTWSFLMLLMGNVWNRPCLSNNGASAQIFHTNRLFPLMVYLTLIQKIHWFDFNFEYFNSFLRIFVSENSQFFPKFCMCDHIEQFMKGLIVDTFLSSIRNGVHLLNVELRETKMKWDQTKTEEIRWKIIISSIWIVFFLELLRGRIFSKFIASENQFLSFHDWVQQKTVKIFEDYYRHIHESNVLWNIVKSLKGFWNSFNDA